MPQGSWCVHAEGRTAESRAAANKPAHGPKYPFSAKTWHCHVSLRGLSPHLAKPLAGSQNLTLVSLFFSPQQCSSLAPYRLLFSALSSGVPFV